MNFMQRKDKFTAVANEIVTRCDTNEKNSEKEPQKNLPLVR